MTGQKAFCIAMLVTTDFIEGMAMKIIIEILRFVVGVLFTSVVLGFAIGVGLSISWIASVTGDLVRLIIS